MFFCSKTEDDRHQKTMLPHISKAKDLTEKISDEIKTVELIKIIINKRKERVSVNLA